MESIIIELNYDKETKNKLRWKKVFSKGSSEIHILKWRVPESIPKIIKVEIKDGQLKEIKRYTEVECKIHKESKYDPIYENIRFKEEFGNTYSYVPIASSKERHFDFFHIPKELLKVRYELLNIRVDWN